MKFETPMDILAVTLGAGAVTMILYAIIYIIFEGIRFILNHLH